MEPEPTSPQTKLGGKPFTVAHFKAWAKTLVLDNGKPWVVEPFQEAFVRDVFAGTKACWLIVPEGNAKTTLIAGLALYHIQHKPNSRVPIAASARDQAEIMYSQAAGFIERDETGALTGFKCLEGYRRIRYDATHSRIQVYAADDRTGDGVIPTLALIDELHRHRDLRLYRTWRGKLDKRQGQIITISTRGEPGSEFEKTLEKIRREAAETTRTETFTRAASPQLALHEWGVPEGADVEDMALVKRANPLKAITVSSLREKFAAPEMTLSHWRRFTCDLPTRSENSAITEAEWYGAKGPGIPEGQGIWLGLDVGWKWDTTAAVPFWMPDDKHRYFGPAEVLVPPRNGNSLDIELIKAALRRIHERNPIHTVVMDMSAAQDLAQWIADNAGEDDPGIGAEVIEGPQTNPFHVQYYDDFMEALRNGWLKHSGDPALTTHVLNAIARELPLGDTRFDRPHESRLGPEQERRVVDALTAASMVHSVAVRMPVAEQHEPNFAWA